MIGGKHGAEALKVLATPETGGTFTCPECVKHYSHAKDWEKRYYAIKALFSSALSAENKLTKKELRERLQEIAGREAA